MPLRAASCGGCWYLQRSGGHGSSSSRSASRSSPSESVRPATPLDAGVVVAALLGVGIAALLWWAYFDWVAIVAESRLASATGAARAALARDAYSYLHLPRVAGIVLFALGLKKALAHVGDELATVAALSLTGGVALYLLAHVGVRFRIGGGLGHGRPTAVLLLAALIPLSLAASAVVPLALVAAVCTALIAYEALRYRESRARIRETRQAPA